MKDLINQLKIQEGFRMKPYKDTLKLDTIGYGYCLSRNPLNLSAIQIDELCKKGITEPEAEKLLVNYVIQLKFTLTGKLPWWSKLTEPRQDVLINMAYNLGVNGVLAFKKTLSLIEHGDYIKAGDEMLNSKWAKQVHGRSKVLSDQMKTGKYKTV